jgi:GNAT superfamily N-acetyltransferase
VFKIASEARELAQIRRLNYRTFVEEIPQHPPRPERSLADRFEPENTYIACLRGGDLVGMVAVRARRPFSLDFKLADLDSYLPAARSPCEIRLLAVEPAHRRGVVFRGLARLLVWYCRNQGHDLALISGTVRQLPLYRHLGFVPFGPLVGSPEARFQPMYLTWDSLRQRGRVILGPSNEPRRKVKP